MKKNKTLGIIRHLLTFGGGALVVSGKLDPGTNEVLIGGLIAVIGGIWSIFSPEKNQTQ